MDRVAGMVLNGSRCTNSSSFSPCQRISLQLEEELERDVWDSLEADKWALLSDKWEQYFYETQGNAFAFSEG